MILATQQQKVIMAKELQQTSLLSWHNAHRDATPVEIARAEWVIKKLIYRGRRAQGRIG